MTTHNFALFKAEQKPPGHRNGWQSKGKGHNHRIFETAGQSKTKKCYFQTHRSIPLI